MRALLCCLLVALVLGAIHGQDPADTGDAVELSTEKRSCAQLGAPCKAIPWIRCCGTSVCYRENGFHPTKPGEPGSCVKCIPTTKICQRDNQCCFNNVKNTLNLCDKTGPFRFNGICGSCRTSGRCYRDKQCCNKCNGFKVFNRGTCS